MYIYIVIYSFATILVFVLNRFRLPVIPFLSIFSGIFIHQILLSLKNKKWIPILKRSGVILMIGLFVYSPLLYSKIYPLVNPKGFVIANENFVLIKDFIYKWDGVSSVILQPNDELMKKFILSQEPQNFKSAELHMRYACEESAKVNLKINPDKNKEILVLPLKSTNLLIKDVSSEIPLKYLRRGENCFVLEGKEGIIGFPVDRNSNWGHSYFNKKRKKGELMFCLKLIK